jgi:hypothetical protein
MAGKFGCGKFATMDFSPACALIAAVTERPTNKPAGAAFPADGVAQSKNEPGCPVNGGAESERGNRHDQRQPDNEYCPLVAGFKIGEDEEFHRRFEHSAVVHVRHVRAEANTRKKNLQQFTPSS